MKLTDEKREHYKSLINELGKLRCWLSGYRAGKGALDSIPGEQAVWQVQNILDALVAESKKK